MAQEQKKSLDLASVKTKLKDYEQLLKDYYLDEDKTQDEGF